MAARRPQWSTSFSRSRRRDLPPARYRDLPGSAGEDRQKDQKIREIFDLTLPDLPDLSVYPLVPALRDELQRETRSAHEKLVAPYELLLALDAYEYARARPKIRQQDRPRLLLDETVLLAHERVAGEHEVAVRRADLKRRAACENARTERAPLEHLHDPKRRNPLRRRVIVSRTRTRLVLWRGIAVDAQELVADDELVARTELHGGTDPQKDTVAGFEVVKP